MDEALKMMTEFILEMNVSQKEEIRKLNTDLEATKRHNEDLYFRVSKLEELRTKLRSAIFENVKWKDGKAAYITKMVAQVMRDLGAMMAPENAFLLNLGLETLHLRMPRHCENAQKVAEYLENHPKVKWVNYCGLPSSKYYDLAKKYVPNGGCGVMAFAVKGDKEDAIRFMDSLKLIAIVTHVADARSCVLNPASHTHRQLNDEQLREAGIDPDLIRLSVGIEDADDLIADIEQALQTI